MWIIVALTCAFVQALWMALSKRHLQTLSPLRFMLFLRMPIIVAIVPMFLWCEHPQVTARFWVATILTAVAECVRITAFAQGTRRDYYATYSLLSTSPVFVLLLAPHLLGEKLTLTRVLPSNSKWHSWGFPVVFLCN